MHEKAKRGSLKGRTCKVDGCDSEMRCREMCLRHYLQFIRHRVITPGVKEKSIPPERRFWSFVTKGSNDECWIWNGSRNKYGYGKIRTLTAQLFAHRLSYEMHKGPIPDGQIVRHMCHNPPCVNPAHLLVGTYKDNSDDKFRAGRGQFNEDHPRTKYSNEVVAKIRSFNGSYREIAKVFGISEGQARNIRNYTHRPPLK